VLAGAVIAAIERGFGTAPEIDPEATVDLELRFDAFAAHRE
jgi:hypothetical protein